MKNNNVFNKKKSSQNLKYFILSFAVFILVLSVISVFLFMKSLDFNIDNLAGQNTTSADETTTREVSENYSVSNISGKTNILFICTGNSGELSFAVTVNSDFDGKTIKVKSYDGEKTAVSDGKTLSKVYSETSVTGVKEQLQSTFHITVDKYIVCTQKQLKDILALFDKINVNIEEKVDFHSYEFNLQLEPGNQVLSNEIMAKYLMVADDSKRANAVCDIINSVLTPEYTENSQKLFTEFVNSCETDISVIDYSKKIENIVIYSKSADKFPAIAE